MLDDIDKTRGQLLDELDGNKLRPHLLEVQAGKIDTYVTVFSGGVEYLRLDLELGDIAGLKESNALLNFISTLSPTSLS